MTGAEHYRLAEDILRQLREDNGTVRELQPPYKQELMISTAQVHATLALTMATLTEKHPEIYWGTG